MLLEGVCFFSFLVDALFENFSFLVDALFENFQPSLRLL